MATIGYRESDGVRGGAENRAWLTDATTWFAVAAAGMLAVFIGLALNGYLHDNGSEETSIVSLSNPGNLIAGFGIALTSAAVLVGLSLSVLRGIEDKDQLVRRFAPLLAAWVMVAAIGVGSITYLGASGTTVGHGGHDATTTAVTGEGTADGGDAGVAVALQDEGIDPTTVDGALTQGSNGEEHGGKHDRGKHATFTQLTTLKNDELIGMFPEGLVSADTLPLLKEQVAATRAFGEAHNTVEKAVAAGFVRTTSDVPYMGQHYLNFDYVRDGVFDPSKPEGLLFSKVDGGEEKLVGVWYLLIPGIGDTTRETEPAGFAGDLDLWHAHIGLCLVGLSGASEGETRESCEAKGGEFTADLRWMMHVWVAPEVTENQDGFFAYLNGDLFQKQQAAKETASSPSGTITE